MHRRSSSGFLLIEVIISVALTSIVILGLAVGMLASVRSSAAADRIQRVDSALGSFSESLRTMEVPATAAGACPTLGGAGGFSAAYDAYVSSGDGWSHEDVQTQITGIEFWDPAAGSYVDTCPASGDPGAYRLDLRAEVLGDEAVGQVVVSR